MSPPPPRPPLLAANWKMYLLRAQAVDYCRVLCEGMRPALAGLETILFPSFPLIPPVVAGLAGSGVLVGGQDLHPEDAGAHTGDVSGPQLADAGCAWVLCGHSERRRDHGESDELVGRKAAAALRAGLSSMICVGETREQRHAGETLRVLDRQLRAALAALPGGAAGADVRFAVAYEPVWAIGTGETATAATAEEAHRHLRRALAGELGESRAAAVRLLYGGSVTPDNAAGLYAEPDVDGFLVGGASLDPRKFLSIMAVCAG